MSPQPRERNQRPPANLAAYRLTIEYEGGRFSGWQRQGEKQSAQGVRTVAGVLERVLHEAGLRVIILAGSGRTDTGVHALGQVAHLHLPAKSAPTPRDLQRLFDESLPVDVAIREIRSCSPSFHARHDATARSYLYQICRRRSALAKPHVWWIKQPFDLDKLKTAWIAFEGSQDMEAFADLEGEDPRCRILRCEWAEDGALILLRVQAGHFLRKQVRRMVGAAVACALGKSHLRDLQRDLEQPTAEAQLRWAALAAPASGLFLEHVQYQSDDEPGPLVAVSRVP